MFAVRRLPFFDLMSKYNYDDTLLRWPLHTNSGFGKRAAHIDWFMVACKSSICYWNYLEDNWPCAGGLSAMNPNDTQLHDLINAGPIRWRMAESINMNAAAGIRRNPVSKHQIQPEYGE